MENFDIGKELEQLDIEARIDEGVEYEEIIKAISRITMEGEREKYIALLKKKRPDIGKQAIRNDIQHLLKNSHRKDTIKREREELSEEEQKEALALLKDNDFWEHFLDTTEFLGCVGEEENKIFLYGVCTSRKLIDPIGTNVKAESSAGKNFIVSSILQFFPEEETVQFTALTAKALYYRSDSLKNKILVIQERIGAEESNYPIRVLLSEKYIIISTTVKNPDTGRFETVDRRVDGPIAYIETTTEVHIHAENETRLFEIYIDESDQQTQRIHQAQNRRHEISNLNKEDILRPWKNAQRLLKPHPIFIPYIYSITFPIRPLRVRRDKLRFLALIEASAFLFQYQREKIVMNGRESIIAGIEDYTLAYGLIGKILESVLKGLSPKVKELIEAAKKIGSKEFTNKNLEEHIKWSRQTLSKYVDEVVNRGYFDIKVQGGQGKAYRYELINPEETLQGLRTPEEMAYVMTKMSNNVQRQDGHSKPLEMQDKSANVQN